MHIVLLTVKAETSDLVRKATEANPYIPYYFSYKMECFFTPKQSQKSRSVLKDGLFRNDKTCIIAKFRRTDLVICSHSGEGKNSSFSRINMVQIAEKT